MNTLHVTTTTNSWAFRIGMEDANANAPFAPESWFASASQKREYALGFESIKGVTAMTAQFTGNVVPAPVAPIVVPNYKRDNGCEYVRRMDKDVKAIFKAKAAYDARIDRMIALTAEFLGVEGDIIFVA